MLPQNVKLWLVVVTVKWLMVLTVDWPMVVTVNCYGNTALYLLSNSNYCKSALYFRISLSYSHEVMQLFY
jgi:hypothetical protein